MKKICIYTKTNAFSLIEISMVVLVVGLVMAAMIPNIQEQQRADEALTTLERMRVIEEAIIAYAWENGELPCPMGNDLEMDHANFGDAGATTCPYDNLTSTDAEVAIGGVPVRSIGLPDEYAFDGWFRKFTYQVSKDMTATDGVVSQGMIEVRYSDGSTRESGAAFALISHGINGHGAYLRKEGSGSSAPSYDASGNSHANEKINCNCDDSGSFSNPATGIVVQAAKEDSDDEALVFDDVVRFMTTEEINRRLARLDDNLTGPIICSNEATDGDGYLDLEPCMDAAGSDVNYTENICKNTKGITWINATGFSGGQWWGANGFKSAACEDGTALIVHN